MAEQPTVEGLSAEVERLHDQLAAKGINSRQTKDIYGRVFSLPVDSEHKATALNIFSVSKPHMRAFHTSWFGFFSSFFSTFAAAPLISYIKKIGPDGKPYVSGSGPDGELIKADIALANILSVAGTIVFRCLMGYICDILGARKGLGFLLLVCSPAIVGMMFVTNAAGFQACRCVIGWSLATFVACQVWCSQQFAKKICGLVNATAAGWGNLGGGVTNLTMPLIFLITLSITNGDENWAWRLCYIVPLAFHLVGGIMVLQSRDLPDGNYKELELSGAKQKSKGSVVLKVGVSNINAWILTITYGFCFGVELTMNNIVAPYYTEYHGLSPQISGLFASFFGLMNIFARSVGGLLSDWCNKRYGMRGRIWSTWIVQTIEGGFCIAMASITMGMRSPDDPDTVDIQAYTQVCDSWLPVPNVTVPMCGTKPIVTDDEMRSILGITAKQIVATTPPSDIFEGGSDCICNSGTAGVTLFLMICFSLTVQMAEGLHFGVVPYVSRPALGIVSGMVGAGGNLGSVIALRAFFMAAGTRTDDGIFQLGWTIIGVTALMFFVYFPDMGCMLLPAGGLGSYDPQIIKPPETYRGADEMDYSAEATTDTKGKGEGVAVEHA